MASRSTRIAAPTLSPGAWRVVVSLYIGVLILLYIFIAVHTPLMIRVDAPHDDGLFISLGRFISEGRWLGPFNQFTLMRGPGYPAFLAVSNWFGLPISLAHALLHCAAVTVFAIVAHKFIRSLFVSGLLFTLLLWHPATLNIDLVRILRDRIYFDQLLIFLAVLPLAVFTFGGRKRTVLFAVLSGLALGWFWLTREEGVWIVPGLGVIALAAALQSYQNRDVRRLAVTLAIVIGSFATTQLGFRALNWWTYGKFVGVDFKDANFQRALEALNSVRSGGTKPFVSITHEAMRLVFEESPTFASLAPYFEGRGRDWEAFGCGVYPTSCGEINAGLFVWALRAAAEETGHFTSPTEASAFFGRIADEIEAACGRSALDCTPQFISEMPPMTWPRLWTGFHQYAGEAMRLLFLLDFPNVPTWSIYTSSPPFDGNGNKEAFTRDLHFLHYPLHTMSADVSLRYTNYTLSGWYYRAGSDWISVAIIRADGSTAAVRVDRGDSPDIAEHFNDQRATLQRFIITSDCTLDCILQVKTPEGAMAGKRFGDLIEKTPYAIGQGTFYLDTMVPLTEVGYEPTSADQLAGRIGAINSKLYKYLYVPVLVGGAIGFVTISLVYWRRALWNVCYMMAAASWILALSRFTLLFLIHATALPALQIHYFAPTYFMMICASCFSLAAWWQLRRQNSDKPSTAS